MIKFLWVLRKYNFGSKESSYQILQQGFFESNVVYSVNNLLLKCSRLPHSKFLGSF